MAAPGWADVDFQSIERNFPNKETGKSVCTLLLAVSEFPTWPDFGLAELVSESFSSLPMSVDI